MASLMPFIFTQLFDNYGAVLSGGKVYFYSAGTSTPKETYTDAAGGTPNANPIILDASGRANIWLGSGSYKAILKNSDSVTIQTVDNISGGGAALGDASASTVETIAGLKALTDPGQAADAICLVQGYYAQADFGGGWFYWDSDNGDDNDNGVTIRPDSDPATGRWVRMVEDEISVRAYGATGDGVTNDTASFAATDTYAAAQGLPVRVDPGTYVLSTNPVMTVELRFSPSAILEWSSFNPVITALIDGSDKTMHFDCAVADIPTLYGTGIIRPNHFSASAPTDVEFDKALQVAAQTDGNYTVGVVKGSYALADKLSIPANVELNCNGSTLTITRADEADPNGVQLASASKFLNATVVFTSSYSGAVGSAEGAIAIGYKAQATGGPYSNVEVGNINISSGAYSFPVSTAIFVAGACYNINIHDIVVDGTNFASGIRLDYGDGGGSGSTVPYNVTVSNIRVSSLRDADTSPFTDAAIYNVGYNISIRNVTTDSCSASWWSDCEIADASMLTGYKAMNNRNVTIDGFRCYDVDFGASWPGTNAAAVKITNAQNSPQSIKFTNMKLVAAAALTNSAVAGVYDNGKVQADNGPSFDGLEISGFNYHGIFLRFHRCVLTNAIIHGGELCGLYLDSSYNTVSNSWFYENNTLNDTAGATSSGIYLAPDAENNSIVDCKFGYDAAETQYYSVYNDDDSVSLCLKNLYTAFLEAGGTAYKGNTGDTGCAQVVGCNVAGGITFGDLTETSSGVTIGTLTADYFQSLYQLSTGAAPVAITGIAPVYGPNGGSLKRWVYHQTIVASSVTSIAIFPQSTFLSALDMYRIVSITVYTVDAMTFSGTGVKMAVGIAGDTDLLGFNTAVSGDTAFGIMPNWDTTLNGWGSDSPPDQAADDLVGTAVDSSGVTQANTMSGTFRVTVIYDKVRNLLL